MKMNLNLLLPAVSFYGVFFSHVFSDPDWFKSLPCTGKASELFRYVNSSGKLESQKI